MPKRSEGNTRLFSEEDVQRLEEIVYLTHQLGINLAGVDMILKLKKQIKKMQKEITLLFEAMDNNLSQKQATEHKSAENYAKKLAQLKKTREKLKLIKDPKIKS